MWSRAYLYSLLELSLPLGYSTSYFLTSYLLDTWLIFTSEKIHLKEERGQRLLLRNISTSHLSLLFSMWGTHRGPQNGLDLCLKPLVNSVWKMSRKLRVGGGGTGRKALRVSNSTAFRKRSLVLTGCPGRCPGPSSLGTCSVLLTLPTCRVVGDCVLPFSWGLKGKKMICFSALKCFDLFRASSHLPCPWRSMLPFLNIQWSFSRHKNKKALFS